MKQELIEPGDEVFILEDGAYYKQGDTAIVEGVDGNGVLVKGDNVPYPIDSVKLYSKNITRNMGIPKEDVYKLLRQLGSIVFLNQSQDGSIKAVLLQHLTRSFLHQTSLEEEYFEWLQRD